MRWLRTGFKIAAFAALAIVVVVAAIIASLQLQPVETWLVAKINQAMQGEAHLGAVSGTVPTDMKVSEIELQDPGGRWAVIRDVVLKLAPADLLRGRITIGLLAARDIRVDRRPQSSGSKRSGSRSRLPFAIEFQRLELPSVELAPPVVGEEAVLSLEGNATLSGGQPEAHLSVHRLDNGPGRFEVRLDLSGKPERLAVTVDIADPKGKLLDALLSRHDGLPFALTLNGDDPLADWHGRLEATAGPAARLDVNLFLSNVDGYHATVDGEASATALLSPALAELVGNSAKFRFAGAEDPNGRITIDTLRLDLAGASVDGSAAMAGSQDGPLKAALRIEAPYLNKLSPLLGRAAAGSAQLRLAVSGTKKKPVATAILVGKALRLAESSGADDLTVRLKAEATDALGDPQARVAFSGDGRVDNIVTAGKLLTNGNNRLSWTISGSSNMAGTAVELKNLVVDAPGLTMTGQGTADKVQQTLSGTLHLTAADLSHLSELTGRRLSGHGAIDATVSRDPSGTARLRVAGGLDDLKTGIATADALLGGRLTIDIAAQRAENGDLAVEDASLEAANLHVEGRATIDSTSNRASGTFAVDLPNLTPLGTKARPATGHAHLDGTISGSSTAPRLDAVLSAADVTSGEIHMDRIKAQLHASKDPAPAGNLRSEFQSGKLTGTAKARFALSGDGKTLEISQLSFAAGSTTLDAVLQIMLDTHLTSGEITVRSTDLSQLSSLAGMPLSGGLDFRTKLTTDAGQGATFSLSGSQLSLASNEETRKRLEQITANGRFSNLLGTPQGKAKLAVQWAQFGSASFERLSASVVSRRPGRFAFTAALKGEFRAPIELAAAGDIDLAKQSVAARITKFEGKLGDQNMRLNVPLRLTKSKADVSVSGLNLALGGGQIRGGAMLKGTAVMAKLTARDVPLALAEPFVGKGSIGGTVGADVNVGGAVEQPSGQVAVAIRGLRFAAATRPPPPLDLTLDAHLLPGRVAINGRVAVSKGEAVTVAGEVPVRFLRNPFGVTLPRDRAFSMQMKGDGQLENITDLLPIGEDRLSGHYHLDMRAAGTVASPKASGEVTLSDGHYESLTYGTVLDAIALDVAADRDRIVLRRFSVNDGENGTLDISGTALLGASPGPAFNITMALRKFQLVHRDDAVAHGSGNLQIVGTAAEPRVIARLKVDDAQLFLPERLPPGVRKLDVAEIDSTTGEVFRQSAPPSNKPAAVVAALDVKLDIPGQVFVRGRGLDSEWQGHFDVTGTSSAPQIKGSLDVVHGTMNFLGKTLTLSRGTITFVGGSKIEPLVDFLAESSTARITAQVAVTGPAESPSIKLTSNPPLPQDQVLAQLLFGRDITQLTPLEGLQIAQAAAALASGGPGVVDRVRMKFGLDRLNIGSSDQTTGSGGSASPGAAGAVGNTTVSAGRYVAQGVYVGVNQGVSGESRAKMEVEITHNVTVDTTASPNRGNSIGLGWKLDY